MAMRILRIGNNQHGFTLLEVLVALTILAVGLLAAASMQGLAFNSNHVANRISVANMLGQQVLEDFHSLSITDGRVTTAVVNASYPLTPAEPLAVPPVLLSNNRTIPGAGVFTATYTITPDAPINGTIQNGTTQIRVTINYMNTGVSSFNPGAAGAPIPIRTFTTYKMLR